MQFLADAAPPDGSDENIFRMGMFAFVAAPFLFGFVILTAAYIHRRRSQQSENLHDHT